MAGHPPQLGSATSRAVYRDLLRFGARSRKDLVRRLSLSAPTVTRATRELLGAGLIQELAPVARSKGRPQEPLDIEENRGPRFIGIKITSEAAHIVVTTVRGNVLEEMTLELPGTSPQQIVDAVADPVTELAAAHPGVVGVGLSLGGRVAGRSTVFGSSLLEWTTPVDLAAMLQQRVTLPVAIENDLVAVLHGLHWFGIGRSYRSFVLITVGAGVGIGTIHENRVITGHTQLAGLTERLPVGTSEAGDILTLGRAGRSDHLLARARDNGVLGPDDGMDRLRSLILAGDPSAHQLAVELAEAVARAAAGAVALLDPEAIVLGGESLDLVRAAGDVFDRTLRSAVAPPQQQVAVRDLGEAFDEWARGAAIVAIQEFVGAAP